MPDRKINEQLLSIINDLIFVKNTPDLLDVIFNKLKNIFPFDDIGLLHIREDGWHRDLVVDFDVKSDTVQLIQEAGIIGYIEPEESLDIFLKKPKILSFSDWKEQYKHNPHQHFEYIEQGGLKEIISSPLIYGGEVFGIFMLWSKQVGTYKNEDFPVFQKITDCIAVTVRNIIDKEEAEHERAVKESLLQLTKAISSINDTKQLLKVLYNHIKPIFPYDEYGLFVLTEDKKHHYELIDAEILDNAPAQVAIETHFGSNALYVHKDSPVADMMKKGPGLFWVKDYLSYDNHQAKPMYEAGLRQIIAGPLVSRGEKYGMICFTAKKEDFYKEKDLNIFEAIAEQMSIAVSNILANEKLKKEKEFKESLLEITKSISSVNDKRDLLRIIYDNIKPVFPYDEYGLFVLTDDGEHHYELIDAELLDYAPAQVAVEKQFGSHALYTHKGSPIEDIMEKGPNLFLIKDYLSYTHQGPLMYEAGLRQVIAGPLISRGEKFGMISFNSKKENFYEKKDLKIFQAIAEQMSIAVSNILANEKLKKEKEFKESLLEITKSISSVNDKRDLLRIIYENIKPIFPYDECGLFVLTEDGKHHYELIDAELLDHPPAQSAVEADFGANALYEHAGSLIDNVMQTGPGLFQLEKHSDYPQVPYMLDAGLRQLLGGPLKYGGKTYGMLCFNAKQKNFYSEKDFRLFQAIAEQMSIAVSNILANEKLKKEKEFKESLLSISTAIAAVSNTKELLAVVHKKVEPILPFDEYGLFVLTEDKQFHYEIIDAELMGDAPAQKAVEAKFGANALYKHKGSLIDKVMQNEVAVYKLKDHLDYSQVPLMMEVGLSEIMACPLKTGGQPFGMFCLNAQKEGFYQEKDLVLFQAIAEQVSTAVSNILANEKIIEEKRFKEALLSISEAVASIKNRKELFKVIFENVKPLLQFDEFGLFNFDNSGKYHRDLLVTENLDANTQTNKLLYEAGLVGYIPNNGSVEVFVEKGPIVYSLDDLMNEFPGHPFYPFMKEQGIEQILGGPLIYQDKKIGMLAFNSRQPDFYSEKDIVLFKAIADQVSIALINILTNESIIKAKEFSETLMKITSAVASSNTAVELYNTIDKTVKSILPFDHVGVLILNDKETHHYELINERFNNSDLKDIETNAASHQPHYEHKDTSVAWLMENGPTIVSLEKLLRLTKHPRHKDMQRAGIKTLLGGPLLYNGKKFGMLAFKSKSENTYNAQHLSLYEAINKQVAVTTSNLLANNEIIWKNKIQFLELAISRIATDEGTMIEKFLAILKEWQRFIPFNYILILDKSKDKTTLHRYEWLSRDEVRSLSREEFAMTKRLNKAKVELFEAKLTGHKLPDAAFFNHDENDDVIVNNILENFNFSSLLHCSMQVQQKNREFRLYLFNQSLNYQKASVDIIQNIENTLRISLEHMLSAQSVLSLTEQLKQEKDYLQGAVKEAYNFNQIVGESNAMQSVFTEIQEVSSVDATVLILGETGTGKELIARAIHENSARKDRVLVKVNCAAIPTQIVESELFGHEKGSFTGAVQQRIGKFELAQNGTIFLDEIGEMPLELQTKLLRVIQEREVQRLGSNETIQLDIRIIAATNRILSDEITTGNFRPDLFYRLNSYPIQVPPLRARGEDIILLAQFFAKQFAEKYGLVFKGFTESTLIRFRDYNWPGNVRELQNNVEQAIIAQKGKVLDIYPGKNAMLNFGGLNTTTVQSLELPPAREINTYLIKEKQDAIEKAYLLKVLEETKWRVSGKDGAAKILGIAASTLESRMKRLGITRK
ncbi:GAF domain-containing protein [uncultured Croceitalea sp.]|uniref:GAF domain-containing protein n=1 Tax=uncultured Croceitalea sp. TaxID=1798908 RepID=UPI0033066AC2